MRFMRFTAGGVCLALLMVCKAGAEPLPPRYLQFSPSTTKGALYLPDPDRYPEPHIAILVMHRDSNFLNHLSARELPKRGIVALAMNPRCENNEAMCTPWEDNMLDVKQGMQYLRDMPGIESIVLIGHSGGGPTMAFYQAIAERGIHLCQQPSRLVKCGDHLAGLPPADGVIFWDAHLGNGVNAVRSLNPAVINDAEIQSSNAVPRIDPRLDPFNPDNGYRSGGGTVFENEFKNTYFEAQARRMNNLIDLALEELRRIESGTHQYPDDAPFIVPRADISRLMRIDLSIHHATEKPRKLMRNDGSIEDCCVVESVRPADITPSGNQTFRDGTRFLTVRSFLSVRAIRSSNSMDGIDWCTSNNSTVCNVRYISVPALVTAMTGHYFVRNSELIYENLGSDDRDIIAFEGATHFGLPCRACMPEGQAYDGRYDNVIRNDFDYLAGWLRDRFPRSNRSVSAD